MRKPLLAIGLAACVAVGMSGCFVFTGVSFDTTKLKPGKKSTMVVLSRPFDDVTTSIVGERDYPFLFVRMSDIMNPTGPKKFDVGRVFTKKGVKLRRDDDLRDFIISTYSQCGPIATDSSSLDYYAFVAKKRVKDKQKPQKQAASLLGIRQNSLGDGDQSTIGVAVGGADADNDGTYESNDTACSGGATPTLFVKPDPDPRAAPSRADAREIQDAMSGN